ncbi:DUF6924 domain-containing protein [Streptomyces sp. KR55]|uniref:DUF6924 domain-containing protein n=1 Tax=Streptomyces sp. KR55 TaxID=3457425 RepID=UPI003FD1F197
MRDLPHTGHTLLIRTDFSDEAAWQSLRTVVTTPDEEDGFLAALHIVDDPAYRDLTAERLVALAPASRLLGPSRASWLPAEQARSAVTRSAPLGRSAPRRGTSNSRRPTPSRRTMSPATGPVFRHADFIGGTLHMSHRSGHLRESRNTCAMLVGLCDRTRHHT